MVHGEGTHLQPFEAVLDGWFEELSRLYRITPPDAGIRGIVCDVLEAALRKYAPQELARFTELRGVLPKHSAFSFVPAREAVFLATYVSRIITPRPTPSASLNALTEQEISAVLGLPLYAPMIKACDGNLHTLFQLLAQGHRVAFNHGQVAYDRLGTRQAILSYADVQIDLLTFVLHGFFTGTMRLMGFEAEIHFDRLSDRRLDVVLGWS